MKSLIMYLLLFIGLFSAIFILYYHLVKWEYELKNKDKRKKFYDNLKEKDSHINLN